MSERLLTAAEVAERLAVKPGWVLAEARARRVPHHRLGRLVRFAPEHVDALLAATLEVPAGRDRRVADPTPARDASLHAASGGRAPVVPLPGALFPADRRRGRGA